MKRCGNLIFVKMFGNQVKTIKRKALEKMKKKVSSNNSLLMAMCFAYCQGMPFWWNCFFGCRKMEEDGYIYNLSKNTWDVLETMAEHINRKKV